ncbi:MFS transporter [Bacillus smithii]|uniref:MFS transporter n=1 Tax=Bacillus smithii TaxID=1479 RepID=UPI0030EE26C9
MQNRQVKIRKFSNRFLAKSNGRWSCWFSSCLLVLGIMPGSPIFINFICWMIMAYRFYLLDDYGLSIQEAQIYLFVFLVAGVLGTFFGGPLADRFGRRNIIAVSMLGSAPLAVLLPHVPLWMVIPMIALIGFILMTSFSVTVVYAQELMPKKVGMASGLIVGLAFGMGGVGSVLFGSLADLFSIRFVMIFCSLLPLFGLVSWLLPRDEKVREITGQ